MSSVCFFVFKQKTAYEMRISDWSSDVCSSDLFPSAFSGPQEAQIVISVIAAFVGFPINSDTFDPEPFAAISVNWNVRTPIPASIRSEEHTSELQSLMRISYAVFCLKNKKINTQIHITYNIFNYKNKTRRIYTKVETYNT